MAKAQTENGFTKVANELLEAMCRVNLSSYEVRVFLSVMRLTYGWRRKSNQISLNELSAMSGIPRQHVSRAVARLSAKQMILRNGATGIQTDTSLWVVPKQGLGVVPKQGLGVVPKQGLGVVPKQGLEVVPEQGLPLLVKERKEIKTKKTPTGETARKTPIKISPEKLNAQQRFVEDWKAVYEAKTGAPFVASREDFVLSARLIGDYGLEACQTKAKALAMLCEEGARFPAKGGWADFTIRNMVRNWNSIILQVRMSDREVKEKELMQKIENERKHRERINGLLHTAGAR